MKSNAFVVSERLLDEILGIVVPLEGFSYLVLRIVVKGLSRITHVWVAWAMWA